MTNRTIKTWTSFDAALAWARKNARDYCHAFHRWVIEPNGFGEYAVSIVNVNTNSHERYITA